MHKFRWIVDNPEDVIQKYHMNGEIFEQEELEFIASKINPGDIVLDIGANVGNHSIYLSKMTQAKTIYVIEPIPHTYRILLANVALNYTHNINVDYLGVALGHLETVGYPYMAYGKNNLGGTHLSPEPMDGIADAELLMSPVPITKGDNIFENIHLDFIKIDAETMEVFVLEGLKNTIDKCRPRMYIEVADTQLNEFAEWVVANDYSVEFKYDVHSKGIYANYYVVPNSG